MSISKWLCVVLIVCGIVLFLYGANYYVSSIGWVGMYLFLLGGVALLAFYINEALASRRAQKP